MCEILNLATAHRLVTLTGAGGIGKTRIALALARELLPHFADGVWLAEFSPINDPGLVAATVAAALGLEPGGGEISVQRVAQMLTGRRLLLVLDTCEHVIDGAAALAEAVLRAGSTVHILATSREPLQVEGEWVYPVPPLAVPVENADSQDDPLQYGAVALGFFWFYFPDETLKLFKWAGVLRESLLSNAWSARYEVVLRLFVDERQIVYMGFVLATRILVGVLIVLVYKLFGRKPEEEFPI
jgi:DNA polymerase III delta prime subunit